MTIFRNVRYNLYSQDRHITSHFASDSDSTYLHIEDGLLDTKTALNLGYRGCIYERVARKDGNILRTEQLASIGNLGNKTFGNVSIVILHVVWHYNFALLKAE